MAKTGASGLAALQRLTPDDRMLGVADDLINDGKEFDDKKRAEKK